jgi:hypothetical protein
MPTPAFLDGAERAAWTAAEAAGAAGLVAGWQALPAPVPDIPAGWVPVAWVVRGFLLAGGKAWAATRWPSGNGSASLGLPPSAEPVPADRALVVLTAPEGTGIPRQAELGAAAGELQGDRVDLVSAGLGNSLRNRP